MSDRDRPVIHRAPASRGAGASDIDVVVPTGEIPLSRGASERKLERIDHYDRRAVVTGTERLTTTGTVRLTLEVIDDQPFVYEPGYFIGIQAEVAEFGWRRSPYCIISPPNAERTFELLIRVVPQGPLTHHLGTRQVGDVIHFRGPSGRSMIPKADDRDVVLLATGVGIAPFLLLIPELLAQGFEKRITLYWGLRLQDDICFARDLEAYGRAHPNFAHHVSLSDAPPDWAGLRGRLTESVPPRLETLGDKRFYFAGNGAMIEEMVVALSDLGVDRHFIHQEVFFNTRWKAAPDVVAAIRERFVATDLFSPFAHQAANLLIPELTVAARRAMRNAGPSAPSGPAPPYPGPRLP